MTASLFPAFGRMRRRALLAVILPASCLLVACVTPEPPLYRWGEYENIIYAPYRDGGSDPVNDAVQLSEDMARTEAQGMQVPPGVRIHLAYLYYSQGRRDEARSLLQLERDHFPESSTFVNRLLTQMGAN